MFYASILHLNLFLRIANQKQVLSYFELIHCFLDSKTSDLNFSHKVLIKKKVFIDGMSWWQSVCIIFISLAIVASLGRFIQLSCIILTMVCVHIRFSTVLFQKQKGISHKRVLEEWKKKKWRSWFGDNYTSQQIT